MTVPSSTSSSEPQLPEGRWGRTWCVGLLIGLLLCVGVEMMWRSQGYSPSVRDDADLWALERRRVDQANPHVLAILGASRIQVGFSLETFRERYPGIAPIQLAVDGSSPVAALRDLAEDEDFQGLVICSLICEWMEPDFWDTQSEYVSRNKSISLDSQLDRRISAYLQSRLSVLHPELNFRRVAYALLQSGGLPEEYYIRTYPERRREADYTLVDVEARLRARSKGAQQHQPSDPAEWLSNAREVADLALRITARDGRIAFVRLPSSGPTREADHRAYPRDLYWDRFASIAEVPVLHYEDIDGYEEIPLPDYSHVDRRDAVQYTNLLLDALEREQFFSSD